MSDHVMMAGPGGPVQSEAPRRSPRRRKLLCAALLPTALLAGTGLGIGLGVAGSAQASPAADARPATAKSVHVHGVLTPKPGKADQWYISGDMVGTYTNTGEKTTQVWRYPNNRETRMVEGTDMMDGCLDRNQDRRCQPWEPRGVVYFEFKRLGTWETSSGRFIASHCIHPVIRTNQRGAFAGGVINMSDTSTGHADDVYSDYEGQLLMR